MINFLTTQVYSLGGHEVSQDSGGESITVLDPTKTMVVTKLTADDAVAPKIVPNLQTISDVFDHYKPELEVEFTDADGAPVNNKLQFRSVDDFGKKGVIEKSDFLQALEAERVEYQKFLKMLKIKQMQNVLKDPEAKAAYLGALRAMIKELEDAGA